MSEAVKPKQEFEQTPLCETERKFIPLFPERLAGFRLDAVPIEQYYLSHPSEDFSLRFRELPVDGEPRYEATLKTTGKRTKDGLKRLEVTTEVSPAMYEFYRENMPLLQKLRAEPAPHIAIDFFADGHVQVESEQPLAWQQFCREYGLEDQFADLTGDRFVDNEWRAHHEYRRQHDGQELLRPAPELDTDDIVRDILATSLPGSMSIAQIRGRSGSGKSTMVRQIQQKLEALGVRSDVISTDDYHRGQSWLEARTGGQPWVDWDDPIVYDTEAMARDIELPASGQAIPRRRIDFSIVEPVYEGERQPVPVLLVEGIYAGAPEIARHCQLGYDMPTPLATSVGRRLLRDMRERPEFADPKKSLRYMLKYAEPAYRKQATAAH